MYVHTIFTLYYCTYFVGFHSYFVGFEQCEEMYYVSYQRNTTTSFGSFILVRNILGTIVVKCNTLVLYQIEPQKMVLL